MQLSKVDTCLAGADIIMALDDVVSSVNTTPERCCKLVCLYSAMQKCNSLPCNQVSFSVTIDNSTSAVDLRRQHIGQQDG